jgi:hypothetical protein
MTDDIKKNKADIAENGERRSGKKDDPKGNVRNIAISQNRKYNLPYTGNKRMRKQKRFYPAGNVHCVTARWNRTEDEQRQIIFYLS